MGDNTVQKKIPCVTSSVSVSGLRLIVMSVLCGVLLCHCSDPNIDAPSINNYHPPAWLYPDHGAYIDDNGVASCTACHGEFLQGNEDIGGCMNTCHFSADGAYSPPESDWQHGSTLHESQLSYAEICNNCHTIMRQYNRPPDACHDCHGPGISHPVGQTWLDKNSSEFHGESDQVCNSCHIEAVYCSTCHFGIYGSRIPPGSDWTHGLNSRHVNFESVQIVCNKCHNLNRSYGHPPSACHDCHDD